MEPTRHSTTVDADDVVPVLRRGPFLGAGLVSLAGVIIVLPWLVAAAFVVGAAGLVLAARAATTDAASRAALLVSLAFGLAVGPSVYMLLAAVVAITS